MIAGFNSWIVNAVIANGGSCEECTLTRIDYEVNY